MVQGDPSPLSRYELRGSFSMSFVLTFRQPVDIADLLSLLLFYEGLMLASLNIPVKNIFVLFFSLKKIPYPYRSGSQTWACPGLTWSLVKIQIVQLCTSFCGAREFAFLTSPQAAPMLLVQGPPFESHCPRVAHWNDPGDIKKPRCLGSTLESLT